MFPISRFIALPLGNQKVHHGGNHDGKAPILPARGPLFPIRRDFAQHQFRHQIHMPAVLLLELTSNQRIVAQAGDLIRVRDGSSSMLFSDKGSVMPR